MTTIPPQHHSEIVDRAVALVDLIRHDVQTLLDGLADRPKPGAKAKAREAVQRLLRANGDLWRYMEGKKPVQIVGSCDQGAISPMKRSVRLHGWTYCPAGLSDNDYLLFPAEMASGANKHLFWCLGSSGEVAGARSHLAALPVALWQIRTSEQRLSPMRDDQEIWLVCITEDALAQQFYDQFVPPELHQIRAFRAFSA